MGTIIGIGGGFEGRDEFDLAHDIIRLSGKENPLFLHIPTTSYDIANAGTVGLYAKMGCEVDILYLTHAYMTEAILAEKIRAADIIHVPGGNLKFVMDVWKRTNAAFYLREAFEAGKVLFGGSSGSMCWFEEGFDDCGPENSFMFIEGLGLLPYNNVPHYEGAFWQQFNDYADKTPRSTIACENGTAICYLDGKWSLRIASARPDARVWFFDAKDGYKRYDLTAHPEILERL